MNNYNEIIISKNTNIPNDYLLLDNYMIPNNYLISFFSEEISSSSSSLISSSSSVPESSSSSSVPESSSSSSVPESSSSSSVPESSSSSSVPESSSSSSVPESSSSSSVPESSSSSSVPESSSSSSSSSSEDTSWDLSSNVVAQYKLNDNTSNFVVTNEQGTNGTLYYNHTNDAHIAGKINGAFDFAGGGGRWVNCNQTFESTFQNAFSVECWIKPNDGQPASIQTFFGSDENSKGGISWSINTDGSTSFVYKEDNINTTTATTSSVFPNGATSWTHLVATVSSSGIKLYIDNGTPTTGSMSGITMINFDIQYNLYLGAQNDDGSKIRQFLGSIDNFRIFNKELSATEVGYLYNSGSGTENNSNI